ncbi:segregation and condensation protein A [Desulforamulus hydrothermalis]|uniref:Segregation and condensation protein A n=1 Tax=Desulforamulus hydrothermalis Lam5 = DSM 18033 TaxID=1121428 RepID=K8E0D5_9FIRM|nr:segregation/condensation protein A [Desulforamulus hydrothermalis]CCO08997.1 Segregation and condensation protein A [Desulforamulus hydrothermalis Lam5 = DSM 18033]SHG76547.1 condensin subunit ScpA [Desulforamulus hydrothermalis Lam5 = DSM 18033]
MSYQVKLATFEGPLDLLLHLIDKEQINIYDIPIAQITSQYLSYLQQMQALDIDVASEFLVMAATLVSIKARMLLPRSPGDQELQPAEPDPREELVQRLLEYRKFKEVAAYLKERESKTGKTYTRNNSAELYQHLIKPRDPLGGVTLEMLLHSLQQVLRRAAAGFTLPEAITREEIQVPEKMRQLMARLLLYPQGLLFSHLFAEKTTLSDIVVTFLAVLELLKTGQIEARQCDTFGEITILRRTQAITGEG